MSRALVCDRCATVLVVDDNDEDLEGEVYGWIKITSQDGKPSWDACTRACAHELLDADIAEILDARSEAIVKVVRTIRNASPEIE